LIWSFVEQLQELLESGVDVNAKFEPEVSEHHAEMTPLALAAALNKVTAVKVCTMVKRVYLYSYKDISETLTY
jgi:hypothetical protein